MEVNSEPDDLVQAIWSDNQQSQRQKVLELLKMRYRQKGECGYLDLSDFKQYLGHNGVEIDGLD